MSNRTKTKIIGFSKTARWNSIKTNSPIYFFIQLRISKSFCSSKNRNLKKSSRYKFSPSAYVKLRKTQNFHFRFEVFDYRIRKDIKTDFVDFHRISSSSFRETDNFRLCPISQLSTGQNQKKMWLVHFFLHFFLFWIEITVYRYLKKSSRNHCTMVWASKKIDLIFLPIWLNDRKFFDIDNFRVPGVIAVMSSISIFKVPGVIAVKMLVL